MLIINGALDAQIEASHEAFDEVGRAWPQFLAEDRTAAVSHIAAWRKREFWRQFKKVKAAKYTLISKRDVVVDGCLPIPDGAVFGGRVRFREMRAAGCRCDDKRWWDGLDGGMNT